MDDFTSQLLAEEADLERKLTAVRAMKAAYGIGMGTPAHELKVMGASKPRGTLTPRQPRTTDDRKDKFGSYGQNIIDKVLLLLPPEGGAPIATRVLVDMLHAIGVEVRGDNKVNALSALLARSSKIKGYGKSGWTRVGAIPGTPSIFSEALLPNVNEPHSVSAGGSETALDAQAEETTEC